MLRRFWILFLVAALTLSAVIVSHQTLPDLVAQATAKSVTETIDAEVAAVTIKDLLSNHRSVKVQPRVRRTIVDEQYAIATWQWGEAGGQAVLIQQDERWKVLTSGGGAVDRGTLQQAGVPEPIADRLMQKELAARKREEKH